MSQHLSGNMNNTASFDYGAFIQIFNFRFRKDLVTSYGPQNIPPKEDRPASYGIHVQIGGTIFTAGCDHAEDIGPELERLDWIFKRRENNASQNE